MDRRSAGASRLEPSDRPRYVISTTCARRIVRAYVVDGTVDLSDAPCVTIDDCLFAGAHCFPLYASPPVVADGVDASVIDAAKSRTEYHRGSREASAAWFLAAWRDRRAAAAPRPNFVREAFAGGHSDAAAAAAAVLARGAEIGVAHAPPFDVRAFEAAHGSETLLATVLRAHVGAGRACSPSEASTTVLVVGAVRGGTDRISAGLGLSSFAARIFRGRSRRRRGVDVVIPWRWVAATPRRGYSVEIGAPQVHSRSRGDPRRGRGGAHARARSLRPWLRPRAAEPRDAPLLRRVRRRRGRRGAKRLRASKR